MSHRPVAFPGGQPGKEALAECFHNHVLPSLQWSSAPCVPRAASCWWPGLACPGHQGAMEQASMGREHDQRAVLGARGRLGPRPRESSPKGRTGSEWLPGNLNAKQLGRLREEASVFLLRAPSGKPQKPNLLI